MIGSEKGRGKPAASNHQLSPLEVRSGLELSFQRMEESVSPGHHCGPYVELTNCDLYVSGIFFPLARIVILTVFLKIFSLPI